ncbi:hypothetical protein Pan216_53290 [Planctomycetes bacterium Pan216]|uniref:Uncharacterized protein n=1 Tax=Kolteria novifilia TaxID=2527975 RepID=A0A518BBU5_9BACT|nr:hypothetical protein Pan216_53290 [Planctomycetes bacterium Pan216]
MTNKASVSQGDLADSVSARTVSAHGLFAGYEPRSNTYDEHFSQKGVARKHVELFGEEFARIRPAEFRERWRQAQRLVHENGITYSPFGDPHDQPRPWNLDAIPLLISSQEWRVVSAALEQRAVLLNRILADLYGPQELLRRGLLPPEILFSHPGFHRPLHGQRVPDDVFLHLYAADLARAPDGKWWILADRTEAPSGTGYALENRLVISRMLPDIFRKCHTERLAPYFIALQEKLHSLARQHRDNPRIVLLTNGPDHAHYFEDAYLARYLGYTLVEGGDLALRNNQVMLKTLGGLLPIDVILRRPNSGSCDPLELEGDSQVGAAGLLQAVRCGNVSFANALGSGLVESPIFMAFLPQLARILLGESLKIPGVATWWCGDPSVLKFVLERLDRVTIRPAFRQRGGGKRMSERLNSLPREELAARIKARPRDYVAQEQVSRSSCPAWMDRTMVPAHVTLRAFLVSSNDSYKVMQGGLARISPSTQPPPASSWEGEGSKDTWILSEGPVRPITLLQKPGHAIELRRGGVELPSRVADNLYWLGRNLERADAAARVLRALTLRLTSEIPWAAMVEIPVLLRVVAEQGQIEPGYVVDGIKEHLPSIERVLPNIVFDLSQPMSLRSTIERLCRSASIVRDRISVDSWHIIHRIDERFRPSATGHVDLSSLIELFDEVIIDLAAFGGMVMESMTRTHSWRFLDIGRRVERCMQTIGLVKSSFVDVGQVQGPILEALLEVADSRMTYRSRYLANLQMAAVLDLVLTDETNPRSLAHQLLQLVRHVEALPRDRSKPLYGTEQRLAMAALHAIRMADVHELARFDQFEEDDPLRNLMTELEVTLPRLSDAISHKYLMHVGPAQQLSTIRPE